MSLRQLPAGSVAQRRNRIARPSFRPEMLEPRRLLAATPTDFDQYMLEVINRGRADPAAEAVRLGIDLNEGLAPGTITTAPKQPLAFNPDLLQSAQDYTTTLLAAYNYFDHFDNGTTPQSRMAAAGYNFTGSYTNAENLDVEENSQPYTVTTASTVLQYSDLFIDSGEAGRGHRLNLMDGALKEIGIGVLAGTNYMGTDMPPDHTAWNAVLTTQDFASSDANPSPFLTGVAFTDTLHSNFYAPGEGLGNVTVTATRTSDQMTFSTTTWSSGGYSLPVPAGTYTVVASGGSLANPITLNNITLGTQNVEADFMAPAGSVLAGRFTGTLPAAPLVVGQKARVIQKLVLTNTGPGTLTEKVGIAYFLGAGAAVDGSSIALPGGVSRSLNLKTQKQTTIPFLLIRIPSGVTPGTYHIIAEITDPSSAKIDVATSGTVTIDPARIDLTGAFVKASASVKNGRSALVTISITNDGNVPAIGPLPVQLALSTIGAGDPSPIDLPLLTRRLNLAAGKTIKLVLHSIISGVADHSYFVLVSLDPANTFHDVNPANNAFASASAAITVSG